MADASYFARRGKYYVGVDLPWYVSHGMVESRLESQGFRSFVWHDRSSDPVPVDVHVDPHYSDGWDEWLSLEYVGPEQNITLPGRPSFIVRVVPRPPAAPPVKVADTTKGKHDGHPSAAPLLVGGGVVALYLLSRVLRRF
jgi:hypothetical protein